MICEHDGCQRQAIRCRLPNDVIRYFCVEHAPEYGFCYLCGEFWGGIESFDFGPGYCENCAMERDDDDWEDYDEWELMEAYDGHGDV